MRMGWLLLSLDLGARNPEEVEQHCESLGAMSVTLTDAGDAPVMEPLPGATPLWPHVRLSALFTGDCDGERLRARLAGATGIDPGEISIEALADRNWNEEWRKGFQPLCFGDRLWICPGGQRPEAGAHLAIDLDPGLAFGTGTHPSTALCLEWLCAAPLAGSCVIDYGCGSGILSLAAARLGAARVRATDIDPQALQATTDNARHNELDERVTVFEPAQLQDTKTDILVANILANPLKELAPRFASLVRHGGLLAIAGILEDQVPSILAAFEPAFDLDQVARREGWALLAGRRRIGG